MKFSTTFEHEIETLKNYRQESISRVLEDFRHRVSYLDPQRQEIYSLSLQEMIFVYIEEEDQEITDISLLDFEQQALFLQRMYLYYNNDSRPPIYEIYNAFLRNHALEFITYKQNTTSRYEDSSSSAQGVSVGYESQDAAAYALCEEQENINLNLGKELHQRLLERDIPVELFMSRWNARVKSIDKIFSKDSAEKAIEAKLQLFNQFIMDIGFITLARQKIAVYLETLEEGEEKYTFIKEKTDELFNNFILYLSGPHSVQDTERALEESFSRLTSEVGDVLSSSSSSNTEFVGSVHFSAFSVSPQNSNSTAVSAVEIPGEVDVLAGRVAEMYMDGSLFSGGGSS